MSTGKLMDELYKEYTAERFINLNKDQFIYIVNLFPALLVVLSDGIVDNDEWVTVKKLASILGNEFASEELGTEEKEENLSLIYKAEFRYLLKNRERWEKKFLAALKDYFTVNDTSKEFVLETMYLFANASEGISVEEDETIEYITKELGLEE
jgi:tellurite resistance protein